MMPRRQIVLVVLACFCLILLVSPALGERGPSVVQLRAAVQKNPQDPEANYKLGMKYLEMGRPNVAAKYLKEAIRLKPDYPEALEAMAKLNKGQGNYGAAVTDMKKLLKLKPNDAQLRDRLGNEQNQQGLALLKEGNYADAEAAFKAAAKADPKASVPYNNLGIAYSNAGRQDDAIRAFQGALQRDSQNAEAHYNLGLLNVAAGNKVAAYAEFLALRNLNPALAHQLDYLTNLPQRKSEYREK
jgi:protein O-GlcNAc transferase